MSGDVIDNRTEFHLLYQGLTRAEGFHLYLVQCNNSRLQSEIQASLIEQLEAAGMTVYLRRLSEPVESLADFLPAGFSPKKGERPVLMVNGLDISFSQTDDSQAFLHRLNFARDVLPKKFPLPLVLWLPVGAFKKIITEAHDLWSWRSGTFYFSTPPEMVQAQFQETIAVKEREGEKGLSEKSYKERLALYTGLLEDLQTQPESEKNRLQQADVMQQMAELHHKFSNTLLPADKRSECLEKALASQKQALAIKEPILGPDHPEAAISSHNLASIYRSLGRLPEAREALEKAIKIQEKTFGPNHPDLASSYNDLSLIYLGLGQLDRALAFQLKDVAISEKVLGSDHPSLASSYNNLSLIYRALGQLDRALAFQLKTTEIFEKVLSPDHPELAQSYNNLSGIYQDLGQLDLALDFQLKTVKISETVLDPNHSLLALAYNNLSLIYKALGQLDRALAFQLKTLEIKEKVLGSDHPSLAASYNNLSLIYRDMKKYDPALDYARRAVAIMQKLFPNGHPYLDSFRKNLADIIKASSKTGR